MAARKGIGTLKPRLHDEEKKTRTVAKQLLIENQNSLEYF